MSTAARARGAAGAVLAGYTRDTTGILEMNFPVFCYGSYAQDQKGRGHVVDFRIPLEIHGVKVNPGDIVFGDVDGVVILPQEVESDCSRGSARAGEEREDRQNSFAGRGLGGIRVRPDRRPVMWVSLTACACTCLQRPWFVCFREKEERGLEIMITVSPW